MKTIVISQPMLFPWVGFFEQIQLADVFVFYDDVQFSKGSFTNRVQLKSPKGSAWMTIPLSGFHLGQKISETNASENVDWRKRQLQQFETCYAAAAHYDEAYQLLAGCYNATTQSINEISSQSILAVMDYFDLNRGTRVYRASELAVSGRSSQRVLDIVLELEGDTYITGHGAARYLDHQRFADYGVTVRYMNYRMLPYRQLHGDFIPYVSILDLIANLGKTGKQLLQPDTIHWQDFLDERN